MCSIQAKGGRGRRAARLANYDAIRARFGQLLSQRSRTSAENQLMELLGNLIREYDSRDPLPGDDSSPAEKLQFLLDHCGKSANDLIPVFGHHSHVNEALSGKRPISVEQARRLGQLFRVKPGLFVLSVSSDPVA
jgi:HTH-type transcriptional regulator/antitoxin HigA